LIDVLTVLDEIVVAGSGMFFGFLTKMGWLRVDKRVMLKIDLLEEIEGKVIVLRI
jgi:hypothetical protein